MSRRTILWLVSGTLLASAFVVASMFVSGDRRILPAGAMTDAHHQLEMSCETCHGTPDFADTAAAEKALNKSCLGCHEDELKAADDSHPRKTFRNPRMAAYWDMLDARLCTTCHVEHRPEITRVGAVTVAMDFCMACHAEGEQDVRIERPSHAGLTFDSCASSGCHNYHDNRALYEDFLVKHAHEAWLTLTPMHALAARARAGGQSAATPLGPGDALAPASALADPAVLEDWARSGHAAAGINCGACHAAAAGNASPDTVEALWVDEPAMSVCEDCHRTQARTFVRGRHGMRRHPRIAKPRDPHRALRGLGLDGVLPETVMVWLEDPAVPERMAAGEARLPMRGDAAHRALDCGTCHMPHAVDVVRAAVEACTSCHDDEHSRAFFDSPHHALWLAERNGLAEPGTGVSCATCHMSKIERRGKIATNHNQNDNLRPNEKMIRTVCLDCHGLAFSLDALADTDLIRRNFSGRPTVHVESIEWAVRRAEAQKQKGGN